MTDTKTEMQKYTCNKQVHAVQIHDILGKDILPETPKHTRIEMSQEWHDKYKPEPGGYFIVHDDGLQSYLSKEAFEAWYTANNPATHPLRILCDIHTRWDAKGGTAVVMGAIPELEQGERYIDAWSAIRKVVGLPHEIVKVFN